MKYLRQCLSAELCRLSHVSRSCDTLVRNGMCEALTSFLDGMADASCLERFPTCSLDCMEEIGGPNSRAKERARLHDAHKAVQIDMRNDPDCDASGIRRPKDTTFDAPGPHYLCRNLWKFGANLGQAMTRRNGIIAYEPESSSEVISDIAKILLESNSTLPNSMIPASMERECMKRLMKLRGIFVCFASSLTKRTNACLSATAVSMIEQLNYVAEGTTYQDMSSDDPYARAKAHVLQQNYSELTVAAISSLLSSLSPKDLNQGLNAIMFARDYILAPSLRSGRIELHNIMRQALQSSPFASELSSVRIPHVPFSLCQSFQNINVSSTAELHSLSKALSHASQRRIRELIIHTASGSSGGRCATLPIFNEIMELGTNTTVAGGTDEPYQQLAFQCGSSLRSLKPAAEIDPVNFFCRNKFGYVVDRYLSLLDVSCDRYDSLSRQLNVLRSQTIRNFLIPKLSFRSLSSERRIMVLSVIGELFNAKKTGTSTTDRAEVRLAIDSPEISFASLHEDICPLIKALAFCVREFFGNARLDWKVLELLFWASTNILLIETEDDPLEEETEQRRRRKGVATLLDWSHETCTLQSDKDWRCAIYIYHFSEWMHVLATLLKDEACVETLHEFAVIKKGSSWITGGPDIEVPLLLSPLLATHAALDKAEKGLFPPTEKIVCSKVSNVYAKPVVEESVATPENSPMTIGANRAVRELLVATSSYFTT